MKRFAMTMLVLAVLAFSLQLTASAEPSYLSGKVVAVNQETGVLTIQDSATEEGTNLEIATGMTTEFAGASSLSEIQVGDDVMLEVNQDEATSALTAIYVEKVAPEAAVI